MMLNLKEILPLLVPVILIQLGLQIYSLIDLARRKRVKYGNKLIWALVILFNMIGAIVYLILRGDEE